MVLVDSYSPMSGWSPTGVGCVTITLCGAMRKLGTSGGVCAGGAEGGGDSSS